MADQMVFSSSRGRASNSSRGVRTAVPVPRDVTSERSSTLVLPPSAPNPSAEEMRALSEERSDLREAGLLLRRLAAGDWCSAAYRIWLAVGFPRALLGAMRRSVAPEARGLPEADRTRRISLARQRSRLERGVKEDGATRLIESRIVLELHAASVPHTDL